MSANLQIVLFGLIAALVATPRLLPVDAARWHRPIPENQDQDMAYGAIRVIPANLQNFAKLDVLMRALPRTRVIAGTPQEGFVTYQTRSFLFGFPDYTTIQQVDDQIRLFARLRIGLSDLGVNRKRLETLLAALDP